MKYIKLKLGNNLFFNRWETAWQEPFFKQKFLVGMSIFISLMPIFPLFFQFIQKRPGYSQQDILLKAIPAIDASLPIFVILWFMAFLLIYRALQNPAIYMKFLYGFIVLNLARFITITLVPGNPPDGLIPITDPLSNYFYGDNFITKDLFFSGHTATQLLIFLCLEKKSDRRLALLSTVLMGILVLVQHVHYTIDVVSAPFFTYGCYYISRRILNSESSFQEVDFNELGD